MLRVVLERPTKSIFNYLSKQPEGDFSFLCCAVVGFATVTEDRFTFFEIHFRLIAHLSGTWTGNSASNCKQNLSTNKI